MMRHSETAVSNSLQFHCGVHLAQSTGSLCASEDKMIQCKYTQVSSAIVKEVINFLLYLCETKNKEIKANQRTHSVTLPPIVKIQI